MSCDTWNSVKLEEIVEIKGGKRLPKGHSLVDYKTAHPYIRVRDLNNITTLEKFDGIQYIVEETFSNISRYITNYKDILLSIVGTIGLTSIVGKTLDNASLTENCVKLTNHSNEIDYRFLYYYLNSPNGIQEIKMGTVGAVQAKLPIKNIRNINVVLPPLQQQKTIANILSSLDDKIELNNKINKNLEEMAQALYKQWFVDFEFPNEDGEPYKSSGGEMIDSEFGLIPKGWETSRIKELDLIVTDYVANGSFKSLKENVNLYEEENYAIFVRNTDLKNGIGSGVKFVDQHSYEFLSKSRLDGREVIISNVGDVGSVYRCPILKKPMTLGNNVIMLKSTNGFRYENYLYTYFSSYIGQGAIDSITGGSAQPKFNKTDFRNLKIVLPNKNTLNIFVEIVSEIYCEIDLNSNQNNILSETRDTLLPKLMSGEIEVPIKG